MNYKEIYSNIVEDVFEDHNKDISAALIYISKNQEKIYRQYPDFKEARKVLTAGERNDIIWKIITPF